MRFTRLVAAVAFIAIAGTAHASWPFIQNNQVDDFTTAQPDAAQVQTSQDVAANPAADSQGAVQADTAKRPVPDCCTGARVSAIPSSNDDDPLLRSNG